jgi:hypothetical protein
LLFLNTINRKKSMKHLFYTTLLLFFLIPLYAQTAQEFYKEANELLKNKQPEQALAKYNKALEVDSNFTFAYMNRANLPRIKKMGFSYKRF